MNMISVSSKNLRAVGYDQDTSVLEIEFLNGNAYEYYDVPQYEFDGLMSADSHGTYAHKNIYKNYRQTKLR